jgi:uncharacterized protein
MQNDEKLRIAVIGTGVSGLAAAWLLNKYHEVTVFEKDQRLGGHCNTLDVEMNGPKGRLTIPVDTGFIVYNERTYPNLTALFDHFGVATEDSMMSFSASVNDGRFEYSGAGLKGLLAQKRNLVRPRFWTMVLDILRFYRECVADAARPENSQLTLGDYLKKSGYSDGFIRDHIYPMASSIWSATFEEIRNYPLTAFVRFFSNHGLLETKQEKRPKWRTVSGGSRSYVERIAADFVENIHLETEVISVTRSASGVTIKTSAGETKEFDHVVIAAHSNQALALLDDSSAKERALLGAIRYESNSAFLHTDASMMPRRKRAWASWNYISAGPDDHERLVCLTYWMNLLQNIDHDYPIFVTLNPHRDPAPSKTIRSFDYEHPVFDQQALDAQKQLWALQGTNRTWFCGAYFGYGFHEDGLQSGLAVAEALGGKKRPWTVDQESGRLCMSELVPPPLLTADAA